MSTHRKVSPKSYTGTETLINTHNHLPPPPTHMIVTLLFLLLPDKMGLARASCLREAKQQHEPDEESEEGGAGSAAAHAQQLVSAPRHSLPAYPESPQSTLSPPWRRSLSQRNSTPPKTTFTSYLPADGGRRLSSPDKTSHADRPDRRPEAPLYDSAENRIYDIAEDSVYQEVEEAFRDQSENRVYAEVGRGLQTGGELTKAQASRCYDIPERDDQQVRRRLMPLS